MTDDSAPGWDAIDTALERLYHGVEPFHWGPKLRYAEGGPDPLEGLSAYRRDEPIPHWHYLTYGFSELYEKESSIAEMSGFGFEVTFRVRRVPGEEEPPIWPLNLLDNLARSVFEERAPFRRHYTLDANGPLHLGSETAIHAIAVADDPELPAIETAHGSVSFLQVVGITKDELRAVRAWDTAAFLELLAKTSPLLVTDMDRSSLLDDPEFARVVREGIRRDGSSKDAVVLSRFGVSRAEVEGGVGTLSIRMGSFAVGSVLTILRGRLPFGRDLRIFGPEHIVHLRPGEQSSWTVNEDGTAEIVLSPTAVDFLLETLQPTPGAYRVEGLSGVEIVVEEPAPLTP